MQGSAPAAPSGAAGPAANVPILDEDARVVANRVFQDFDLTDDELNRASRVLAIVSGGKELDLILHRAAEKPGEPWQGVSADRRQECISQVLVFHCAPADMEQMALRTGAGLLLIGDTALGQKILQAASESSFGTEPVAASLWIRIGQLAVYSFLIVAVVAESSLSGLYAFLVPGLAAVGLVILMVWLLERRRWKLRRSQGEAQRYLRAAARMGPGVPPSSLFLPDGSLRG